MYKTFKVCRSWQRFGVEVPGSGLRELTQKVCGAGECVAADRSGPRPVFPVFSLRSGHALVIVLYLEQRVIREMSMGSGKREAYG